LIISRTGWSSELGYEIFLRDGSAGEKLWEHLMAVGTPLGLKPGHTSSIRRIEAGMLSYHADMNLANNPYELGMGRLVDLDMDADFVSKAALTQIKNAGVSQQLVGLEIDGSPFVGSNDTFWPIMKGDVRVGTVTSAIYSPRLEKNIALALVNVDHTALDTSLEVDNLNETRACTIVPIPFYDPKKSLASAS
jgi:aminomethyltransferase